MQIARPKFDEHEIELLRQCLESGWVTQGPFTAEFERRIAAVHRVEHALATTSCTAALHLAAMALGLGPGDEVIVPAFTWITSASCARYVGADVVFADVDPKTFNLDPAAFEAAITPRTRAVVAVHLFGLPADMSAISAIAARHNIRIIEDAACAIGTTYQGRPVGGLGDVGCFSFHPRKVISTGEGGMVTTNDVEISQRVQTLRNHGASPSVGEARPWAMNEFHVLGHNLRLSDIQAAVGVAQTDKLADLLAERRAAAYHYNELLADVDEFVLPEADNESGHSYQSYVLRLRSGDRERRNALMMALKEKDIQTRPGTHAVHRLAYYAERYGLSPADFPQAALCEDSTITLPIFPGMLGEDRELVANVIKQFLAGTHV